MKYKKLLILPFAIAILLLSGCFEDEGNYLYAEMIEPTWLINVETQLIYVSGRGGADARLDARSQFVWPEGKDSIAIEKSVRYEWILNGKVIAEEATITIPTDDIIERAGFDGYPIGAQVGVFSIIEKETGIKHNARVYWFLNPALVEGDMLVYAAKGNNSKVGNVYALSLNNTQKGVEFELSKFQTQDIEGTPKMIAVAVALNVGPSGSVTAITEEGAAEVFDASNMKKVWDLKDQFADGVVPPNFKVASRKDQEWSSDSESFTWINTHDGRVFTRKTGLNFLGGAFISDPYVLDDKGYDLSYFGHTLYGVTNIPSYDKKNRRVLLATGIEYSWNKYRSYMQAIEKPDDFVGAPVHNFEPGTEVFHLSNTYSADAGQSWYNVYYNDPRWPDASVSGTFAISTRSRKYLNAYYADNRYNLIHGHRFNDETVFLNFAATRYLWRGYKHRYDLFSENNKVFAIVRSSAYYVSDIEIVELPFEGIDSKITCMMYDKAGDVDYRHIFIGCEDGKLHVFNVQELREPKYIKTFDFGGKVASVKQIGINRGTLDNY